MQIVDPQATHGRVVRSGWVLRRRSPVTSSTQGRRRPCFSVRHCGADGSSRGSDAGIIRFRLSSALRLLVVSRTLWSSFASPLAPAATTEPRGTEGLRQRLWRRTVSADIRGVLLPHRKVRSGVSAYGMLSMPVRTTPVSHRGFQN